MSKAEQRALEAYPPKYVEQERHSKRMQSEKVDIHQPMRAIYIKGYRQAEKDLELTWEDIKEIYFLFRAVLNEWYGHEFSDEGICQEVLKRFKKRKK